MSRTDSSTTTADELSTDSQPKKRRNRHRATPATPTKKRATSWERLLGTLLSADEVQFRLGLHNPEQLTRLTKERRLVTLPSKSGAVWYPAFQFAPNGMPYKELAPILRTFHEVLPDETALHYMVASWLKTPQPYLEQETPLTWMKAERDTQRLREAAELSAGRLAH